MARSADMPPRCTPRAGGNLLPRAPDDASEKDSDEDDARSPLRLRAGLQPRARKAACAGKTLGQRRPSATDRVAAAGGSARLRGRAVGGDEGAPARRGGASLDALDDGVGRAPLERAGR